MEVPVFLPASQILARLLTVDVDASGLNANTLQGYLAADFALSGHTHSYQPLDAELTAIAGLTSAANTVPSFTGSGTAALLTVGTGASNLVQLTAAAKLPAVDGSLLTNLATGLAATGATTGATSVIQPFTNGIVVGATLGKFESTGTVKGYAAVTVPLLQYGDGTDTRANPRLTPKTPIGGSGFDLWIEGMDRLVLNPAYAVRFASSTFEFASGALVFAPATSALIQTQTISLQTNVANTIVFKAGYNIDTDLLGYDQTHPINLGIAGSSATNAITDAARLRHTSSGTPAAGFGIGLRAQLKSSTTAAQDAGRLTWQWDVATHASRASKGQLTSFYTSSERPAMTWGSNSTVALLSFYDVVTPIARQVLATGAGATVDQVISALQALGLVKQS